LLLDRLINDRSADRSGLEQLGLYLGAFFADPLFKCRFGCAKDGLSPRQLNRELGINRHGLGNLDDIDKRKLWPEYLTHCGERFDEPHISWSAIDRSENATSTISHE
jgi:hypothetical protein